jgi:hypothetical protein
MTATLSDLPGALSQPTAQPASARRPALVRDDGRAAGLEHDPDPGLPLLAAVRWADSQHLARPAERILKPSRISNAVVLAAPFGPSRHFPRWIWNIMSRMTSVLQ